MQTPAPTLEHQWLLQLVGDWTFACECSMGPDQPPIQSTGKQTTRALGSLWIQGEMESTGSEEQPARSVMTLGFDPARGRFVGSFIASCMTHQWVYDGQLDPARNLLTLDTEGPSFADDGTLAKYQDMIEIIDADQYLLSSQYQNSEGTWVKFMAGKYVRVPAKA